MPFPHLGILDPVTKTVIPVADVLEWGRWYEENDALRTVARDKVGVATVSTVFLGVNYGFFGPPLWFETMVFGGAFAYWGRRYETHEAALTGHREAVEMVQASDAAVDQVLAEVAMGATGEVCDRCGTKMIYRPPCKLECPNCGYQRDCSDPIKSEGAEG